MSKSFYTKERGGEIVLGLIVVNCNCKGEISES